MLETQKIAQHEAEILRRFILPENIKSLKDLEEKLEFSLREIREKKELLKPRPPTSLID